MWDLRLDVDGMLFVMTLTLLFIAYFVYKIAHMLQVVITNQQDFFKHEWIIERLEDIDSLVLDMASRIKKET